MKGVTFSLAAGEIYGLLGPNGAGKTTTLKILAGLLAPDGGSVIVDGQLYHREHHELKRRIAYVPDQPFLYYKLSGEEHLNFYRTSTRSLMPSAGKRSISFSSISNSRNTARNWWRTTRPGRARSC